MMVPPAVGALTWWPLVVMFVISLQWQKCDSCIHNGCSYSCSCLVWGPFVVFLVILYLQRNGGITNDGSYSCSWLVWCPVIMMFVMSLRMKWCKSGFFDDGSNSCSFYLWFPIFVMFVLRLRLRWRCTAVMMIVPFSVLVVWRDSLSLRLLRVPSITSPLVVFLFCIFVEWVKRRFWCQESGLRFEIDHSVVNPSN